MFWISSLVVVTQLGLRGQDTKKNKLLYVFKMNKNMKNF